MITFVTLISTKNIYHMYHSFIKIVLAIGTLMLVASSEVVVSLESSEETIRDSSFASRPCFAIIFFASFTASAVTTTL